MVSPPLLRQTAPVAPALLLALTLGACSPGPPPTSAPPPSSPVASPSDDALGASPAPLSTAYPQAPPDSSPSPESQGSSRPSRLIQPSPYPPEASHAQIQRLWIATRSSSPEALRLPGQATFPPQSDGNPDLLQALTARALKEPHQPDAASGAALAWFDAHPGSLEEVLRVRLAFHCVGQREQPGPGLGGSSTCPFDAGTRYETDPATGALSCPLADDSSHRTFGTRGLMMLVDTMGRPRAGDMERLDKVLALKPGMDVVDLGAGVGAYSFLLAERIRPGGTLYALDLDEEVIGYIKFRKELEGAANVSARVSQPSSLGLPPGSADVVCMIDIHELNQDPVGFFTPAFAGSLRETLKPGGRLLIMGSDEASLVSGCTQALLPLGFELDVQLNEPLGRHRSRQILVYKRP